MREYKEYIKLSVHNHFGDSNSERTIDEDFDKKIVFNYAKAINKINEAYKNNFDLLGFTNSNVILVPQYIALKRYAQIFNINLVPGVELNIVNENNDKYLHLVVIFDPTTNLFKISNKLNEFIEKNQGVYININQLVDIILGEKVILIPHGIKQSRYERSSADNPEQFKEIIAMRDAIPIIIEDNKVYHRETLIYKLKDELNKEEINWIEKSNNISCADRQSFDRIAEPTYIWGDNTFNDLYFAVLMQGSRIKRSNDIIVKPNYISKIEISSKNENSQIEKGTIICSHGLNSIIGRSGSGKTLLLNAIKNQLTGKNLSSKTSGISEYNEIYKDVNINLYDENSNPITLDSNWEVFEGDNLYNKILQVYSSDKTKIIDELNLKVNDEIFRNILNDFSKNITDYVDYQLKIDELNNKLTILLANFSSNIKFLEDNNTIENLNISYFVDSKLENEISSILEKIKISEKDLLLVNKYINELNLYAEKYEIKNVALEIKKISEQFNKSININIMKYNKLYFEYKIKLMKQKSLYEIVKKYNSKLGKKIEEILVKKQENLNIIEKIKVAIINKIIIKNKCIIKPLTKKELEGSLFLEKNDLSKLIIDNVKLLIPYSMFKDIFSNNIGSANNKINITKFRTIESVDLCNTDSIIKFLQVFVDENYKLPLSLNLNYNNYMDCQIELKNSSNKFENIETMSAGELSKTYISNMLEQQINNGGSNLIILFDQPDNSLEKKFILEELVDKIDKLRNKYQVFVTTHEPLLVVNADSNNIIKAENDKIAVSSNNHIVYENLSFVEHANTKEKMVETIASLVDGSYDAVKERNKIYGGMLNENRSK